MQEPTEAGYHWWQDVNATRPRIADVVADIAGSLWAWLPCQDGSGLMLLPLCDVLGTWGPRIPEPPADLAEFGEGAELVYRVAHPFKHVIDEARAAQEAPPPSIMAAGMEEAERLRQEFLATTVAGMCDACKQKLRDAGYSLEPDYRDVMPGAKPPPRLTTEGD